MFYKDADAHRNLNYGSCHPKFAFSSVVESQKCVVTDLESFTQGR